MPEMSDEQLQMHIDAIEAYFGPRSVTDDLETYLDGLALRIEQNDASAKQELAQAVDDLERMYLYYRVAAD